MTPGRSPMCGCGCGRAGDFGRGLCQAAYERHRRRQIAYGRWQPRVPAEPVRAHLERLRAAGLRPSQVARLAGVNESTIANVSRPDWERVSTDVHHAILAVPVPQRAADVIVDTALVASLGARRRIQALVAYGWPQAQLARELGLNPASSAMGALVGRPNTASGCTGQSVPAARERAIRGLFERLQMTPGPSGRAREYGRRHGWALPFEWDEGVLDDPNGQPTRARWTPPPATQLRQQRRVQVAELTTRGVSARQIAHQLHITQRTVVRDRHLTPAHPMPAGAPQRPELEWGLDR